MLRIGTRRPKRFPRNMRRLSLLLALVCISGCASGKPTAAPAAAAAVTGPTGSELAYITKTPYRRIVLNDQPVGFWPLDEHSGKVAYDISGHGLNGTIGAHVILGRPGLIKDAKSSPEFSGVNKSSAADDIRIPRSDLLALSKNVSIEAWALPYETSVRGANSGDITIAAYGNDTAPDKMHCRYALELDAHGHVLHFPTVVNGHWAEPVRGPRSIQRWFQDRLLGDRRQMRELYADSGIANPPVPNHLYHLVGTYDGHTARFYIDGALSSALAVEGHIEGYATDNGMGIGGEFANVNPTFYGRINDVAVYSHVLTPEQIRVHYLAGMATSTKSVAHR